MWVCWGDTLRLWKECKVGMAQWDSRRKWRNNNYHTEDRSYIPRFKSVQSERTSCLLGESFDALLKSSIKISNHRGWQTSPLLLHPPWKGPCDTEVDSSIEFLGWAMQMGWLFHTSWVFFFLECQPQTPLRYPNTASVNGLSASLVTQPFSVSTQAFWVLVASEPHLVCKWFYSWCKGELLCREYGFPKDPFLPLFFFFLALKTSTTTQ